MPITPNTYSSIAPTDERTTKFTLSPPPRKGRTRSGSVCKQSERCVPNSPRSTRRRASVSSRPSLSPFLSLVDSRSIAYGINLGAQLSPSVNVIGKSRPRSSSIPCTALLFETDFAPSPRTPVTTRINPSPDRSSYFGITSPVHVLFHRTCTLATLKGSSSFAPTTATPTPPKARSKARPTPIMTSKSGHVNVLLLPRSRDKDGGASIRSGTSASTSTSKSKSRKALDPSSSSKTSKTPNASLRAQRSLTPARGITHDTFRPLPYATHAALDEFFGDPRKMNAIHAHQSKPDQLGARPDEVGYGGSFTHRGADGSIWYDEIEEQEYAWLMGEACTPTPDTARPKEKKSKIRVIFGRRGSVASVSSKHSGWESFDDLRRGSESGTSDAGIVDPNTCDLDPSRPPQYRAPAVGALAAYRIAVDAGAWDGALRPRTRQNVGNTSAPKIRRGRSRRGSTSEERRRPPPLNLNAVTKTLAALGPLAAPSAPSNQPLTARRASLPANCLLPPSLSDAARADFVSSSYQPHPSKRDLNLDPETPWSANLPKDTIYRSIGPDPCAPSASGSPFKAMFARRASLTPLPLRHAPAPLPKSGAASELKGTGHNGTLPKLPPMPTEHGAPVPVEARRKASLADIFRRGFGSKGNRK